MNKKKNNQAANIPNNVAANIPNNVAANIPNNVAANIPNNKWNNKLQNNLQPNKSALSLNKQNNIPVAKNKSASSNEIIAGGFIIKGPKKFNKKNLIWIFLILILLFATIIGVFYLLNSSKKENDIFDIADVFSYKENQNTLEADSYYYVTSNNYLSFQSQYSNTVVTIINNELLSSPDTQNISPITIDDLDFDWGGFTDNNPTEDEYNVTFSVKDLNDIQGSYTSKVTINNPHELSDINWDDIFVIPTLAQYVTNDTHDYVENFADEVFNKLYKIYPDDNIKSTDFQITYSNDNDLGHSQNTLDFSRNWINNSATITSTGNNNMLAGSANDIQIAPVKAYDVNSEHIFYEPLVTKDSDAGDAGRGHIREDENYNYNSIYVSIGDSGCVNTTGADSIVPSECRKVLRKDIVNSLWAFKTYDLPDLPYEIEDTSTDEDVNRVFEKYFNDDDMPNSTKLGPWNYDPNGHNTWKAFAIDTTDDNGIFTGSFNIHWRWYY